jgi:hypothetical protein
MKKYISLLGGLTLGFLFLLASSAQATTVSSQSILLLPGWNIISTPKVLDSHTFSAAETSTNFDIYALDPSKTSGWATLSDLGQTEFTPLYGYFINNKTGSNQTLTFNYSQNLSPNQQLFSRTFTNTGWYTFGVANPSYVLPVGFSSGADTNNPSNIMSGMSGYYDNVVDLTDGLYSSNPDTVYASTTWKSAVASDINSLHDFRETKGYAIFINKTGGLYSGMQSDSSTVSFGTATITQSSFDPNDAGSQPIGTTGFRFSGLKLTAGSSEDITFKSIRWNQTGSVGSTDLANLVTIVNGTSYPTTVDATGKYYATIFPSGIVITKGNSIDVYVQGDIVGSGATGRTFEFDVYKNTDLYIIGNAYSDVVTAPVGTNNLATGSHATIINTNSNPWFQGSTLTISAGSQILISKAPEVAPQNIATAVSNQVLGGYATNFSGEPISVQSQTFTISTSTASLGGLITSVTIVNQNGVVVAGPVDATWSNNGTQIVTFTDTVTYPVGRAVYTLKGKIPSTATNGTTVIVDTNPSTQWLNATGQTTGNSISLSTGDFQMNTMTVKGPAIAVNISAQPASQTVVAGVQNFVFANYQLDATQSGEDVRLSSFPVTINSDHISDLTGCALFNGSTQLNTGSRVVNTLTSGLKTNFSLDNSLTIPKGTSVTLSLQCNVSSSATATSYQVMDDSTAGDYSMTGVTSGSTVLPTFGNGNGGIMTPHTSSFAVNIDSSTPNYTTVAGGYTGVNIGVYKFHATNESVNLTKVGLILTSGSASDLSNVYVYQGSTLLGTAVFPQGNNTVATSTFNSSLLLSANTDVLLTIKADLALIGSGLSGTEGKLVKIDVTNAEGSGLSSGSTIRVANVTAGSLGVRTFKSFPTVAQDTMSSSGVQDGHLLRFKITANSSGPVGIYQMAFAVATSGMSSNNTLVSSAKLNVFTDSGYSQSAGGNYGSSNGQFGATQGAVGLPNSPTSIKFVALNNALEIPAGSTYYFSLDAQVAGITTGSSVTATLLGDSSYDGVKTAPSVSGNLIWSANALTTSNITTDSDWADGYGVLNLPAGGFTQTRSN